MIWLDKVVKVVGAAALVGLAVLITPIVSVLAGALCGWLVGLVFDETFARWRFYFGLDMVDLGSWQIGAMLAFVGAFFRSTFTGTK